VRFVAHGEEHIVAGGDSPVSAARELVKLTRRHEKFGVPAGEYGIVWREVSVTPWVAS
jgi:hypothetical protein